MRNNFSLGLLVSLAVVHRHTLTYVGIFIKMVWRVCVFSRKTNKTQNKNRHEDAKSWKLM